MLNVKVKEKMITQFEHKFNIGDTVFLTFYSRSQYRVRKAINRNQRTNKKDNKALGLMCDNNDKLLALLKECKPYIQKEMENIIKGIGFYSCDWVWKTSDVLTRINATIGESEE